MERTETPSSPEQAAPIPARSFATPRRSVLRTAALAWLPGALGGTQLAGLLFFLNPYLPFQPGPFLRATLVYASLLGGLSTVILLLLTGANLHRMARMLPWALVLVFALSSLGDWIHASVFAFYLPPDINRRLLKCAAWLSLAAVLAFYTALLHTLHRRPYGPRSRLGLGLLAVLSIYLVVERRDAATPRPRAAPRPSSVESGVRPHLAVVGLEGATLDAILPLAEQGQLPFFEQILENGAHGRLESLYPVRRTPLWTTLATGKHPFRHGVVGEQAWRADFLAPGAELRMLPIGIEFERWGAGEPVEPRRTRTEALALWDVSLRLGVDTAVVGWPASEALSAGLVAAYPDRDIRDFRERRPQALIGARPPALALELEPGYAEEIRSAVRALFVDDAERHRLALELLPPPGAMPQHDPVQALFLVLPGLDEVSTRYFGGYSAVQFDGSQGAKERQAKRILAAYYIALDELLRELWERLPSPRLLAVVSAYGTRAPSGLGRIWSRVSGRGDLAGSSRGAPDGVLLLLGDAIRPATFLTGPRLVDVAPTLLYSLGLPLAQDCDGHLLAEAFEPEFLAQTPLTYVPSYETLIQRPGPAPTATTGAAAAAVSPSPW